MNNLKKNSGIFLLLVIVFAFFYPFFIFGKLPVPIDSMVGLYHPFRDYYADTNPNGIAYKNFLITDPFRQQIPWRYIAVESLKQFELPLWNPYQMGGHPLFANMQSGILYPLNIIFFFGDFKIMWSLLLVLQPMCSAIFMYFYLRELKIQHSASILGSIAFAFSGFSIAWVTWNTIGHVAMWLPLLLLVVENLSKKTNSIYWIGIGIFAVSSAFFAGHIQTFAYLLLTFLLYWLGKIVFILQNKNNISKKSLLHFFTPLIIIIFTSTAITFPQWMSSYQLMGNSARQIDRSDWQSIEGWFFPIRHFVQFIAPDFFGNPATLNYWGTWNYGELVGYIGVIPLFFAFYAVLFRRDKKTYFFFIVVLSSFLLAISSPVASIPYILNLPFFSTAQPTRILFIIDFALCVLASFGFDAFCKSKRYMHITIGIVTLLLIFLWGMVRIRNISFFEQKENIQIASRNLIFPTIIFIMFVLSYFLYQKITRDFLKKGLISLIIIVTIFDLFRFGWKFIPFTDPKYFFPTTKVISFLKSNLSFERIMVVDDKILPPNITSYYQIQSLSGYDPLYLFAYGELVAAMERSNHSINPPFGFNRIVNPKNFQSPIIDLLGVKYVLSLEPLNSKKLELVLLEGKTHVYKNKNVFPRAFFVEKIYQTEKKEETIDFLFNPQINLRNEAIVQNNESKFSGKKFVVGSVVLKSYKNNSLVITTKNSGDGFLVVTDTYYPTWNVFVDGSQTTLFQTNYFLRGVIVPKGEHIVEFRNTL